jgi:hypothetical protein
LRALRRHSQLVIVDGGVVPISHPDPVHHAYVGTSTERHNLDSVDPLA